MKEKTITIKDIARMAGVSVTAVSFVINNKGGVSEQTKNKICEVMKANDFIPNASSQRLASKRSENIALVYPKSASPFTDLFYNEIASGITESLTANSYKTMLISRDDENPHEIPKAVLSQDIDGIIFFQLVSKELLKALDKRNFPYVLVDLQEYGNSSNNVSIDYTYSISIAMDHLIKCGHKKIAFLGAQELPKYYLNCFTGYQNSLIQHNLSIQPNWIQICDGTKESVSKAIDLMWISDNPPTAVCCMSDMLAIHAIRHCNRNSISVPQSLSFISIDDIVLSNYISPALTCVNYPKDKLGADAVKLLLQKINKENLSITSNHEYSITQRDSIKTLK